MAGCHVPVDTWGVSEKTKELIANQEGFRGKPYRDTKGFLTIGYGFNLDSIELPRIVADYWLEYLLNMVKDQCKENFSFWNSLNEARQTVLISMAYNLGIVGLLKFRDMIKALEKHDYVGAAREMEDSRWYKEVPSRAFQLKRIMVSGEF